MRESARFAIRLAELGMSLLGEGHRTGTSHACRCPQKPAHVSSRKFSNSCDQELDSHRPEIRRLKDRPSRRISGLGMAYVEIIQGSLFHMVSQFFGVRKR